VTPHEIVIRLGRAFDVLIDDEFKTPPRLWTGEEDRFQKVTEIRIPFADQASAGAALREVSLSVRAVHDTGGEDYRPVVAGEVVQTEADLEFAGDLANAVSAAREREAIPAPEPDTARDMNDMRDWGANGGSVHDALRKSARDAHAGGRITQSDLEDRLRRIAFMERQDHDA
jgi:hypothetical protein